MVQLVSFGRIGVVAARRRPARQRQRQRLLRLPVAAAHRAARLEARGGRHAGPLCKPGVVAAAVAL